MKLHKEKTKAFQYGISYHCWWVRIFGFGIQVFNTRTYPAMFRGIDRLGNAKYSSVGIVYKGYRIHFLPKIKE